MQNYIPQNVSSREYTTVLGHGRVNKVYCWVAQIKTLIAGLRAETKKWPPQATRRMGLSSRILLQGIYEKALSWCDPEQDDLVFSTTYLGSGAPGLAFMNAVYTHEDPFGERGTVKELDDVKVANVVVMVPVCDGSSQVRLEEFVAGYHVQEVGKWFREVMRRRSKQMSRPVMPENLRQFSYSYALRWMLEGRMSANSRKMFGGEIIGAGQPTTVEERATEKFWFKSTIAKYKCIEAMISEMAPALPGYTGAYPEFANECGNKKAVLAARWTQGDEEMGAGALVDPPLKREKRTRVYTPGLKKPKGCVKAKRRLRLPVVGAQAAWMKTGNWIGDTWQDPSWGVSLTRKMVSATVVSTESMGGTTVFVPMGVREGGTEREEEPPKVEVAEPESAEVRECAEYKYVWPGPGMSQPGVLAQGYLLPHAAPPFAEEFLQDWLCGGQQANQWSNSLHRSSYVAATPTVQEEEDCRLTETDGHQYLPGTLEEMSEDESCQWLGQL